MRENTVALKPPRALWVPFMLGRPFGVPGDAAFQRRVVLAVLRLLEAPTGPVLEDYAEDAPQPSEDEVQGIACPVSFDRTADESDLGALLAREIEELAPWHDMAVARRGRTTTGVSGVTIEEAGRMVASQLNRAPEPGFAGMSAGATLKLLCDDIRAYYFEAAAAKPGGPDPQAILNWFWRDTAAGRAFLALRKICIASEDPSLQVFGGNTLVPRAISHALGRQKNAP